MRKISKKQMPLMPSKIDHPQANELNAISCILDENPTIYELALQDLSPNAQKSKKGAKGMTAEQVVRAAIVKQMFQFSYIEIGREVRIDCTVVEANIHAPSDSTLLWDSITIAPLKKATRLTLNW